MQTDASAVGLGAVLEQNGHPVVYASRALTSPEKQYAVIQRECLAIVFALKQFQHYILGGHFKILTDHAPLQWLSAQKMEGMLCRWALAIQEYDFEILYRKGSLNANADALSCCTSTNDTMCAATLVMPHYSIDELRKAQEEADEVTSKLLQACSIPKPRLKGPEWNRPPLQHYRQLWS